MIDFYTWTTPNGRKVSILLEETGLPYTTHPIDIGKGAQFTPEFLAIAPNNKIPAIVDHTGDGKHVSIFESGAILVYLAEKTGQFLPSGGPERAAVMQWLFWQMGGIGPIMGQLYHFANKDDLDDPYPIDRFRTETGRLMRVMDEQLATTDYLAGAYSIADMAVYPWVAAAFPLFNTMNGTTEADFASVARWLKTMGERPAVARGMAVP
ncbi:MAG: glutathione S-transferase N-terminal domain-containing protein [Pseudomonadota bacterium]